MNAYILITGNRVSQGPMHIYHISYGMTIYNGSATAEVLSGHIGFDTKSETSQLGEEEANSSLDCKTWKDIQHIRRTQYPKMIYDRLIHLLTTVRSWRSYLTIQSFRFLIYEMEEII